MAAFLATAQPQTTTYSGIIKGYNSNMNFKTGQLILNNVVTGIGTTYPINIQADGTFAASFPMVRKQECFISLPFFHSNVYFEPGKNIVQDFDITEVQKVSSVFKGNCAATNNDMNKVRLVLADYNWDVIYSDIYQFTPEQYKDYFLKIQSHKLVLIDSIAKGKAFDRTAYKLAMLNVQYNIASILIHYNSTLESARGKKGNSSSEDQLPEKAKPEYYDFLQKLAYNDPFSMASFSYFIFINRLMYMDPVYDKAGRKDFTTEINKLKVVAAKDSSYIKTLRYYQDLMKRSATAPGEIEKARPLVMKSLVNKDASLELDIMQLQPILYDLDRKTDTLSDAAVVALKFKIKNKFLIGDAVLLNNNIKQAIRDTKNQPDYVNKQVFSNTPADSILVNMLDKYKGKVVLIDFWATWCSPCIAGIQQIAPLKEELAKQNDIVFLYITDASSPEKTYQRMIPGIKGEHYRLPANQYSFLTQRFQINGIPHYAVVNKQGVIVNSNFRWGGVNEVKDKLAELRNE